MKILAIFPLLFFLVAMILAFLCLFAGRNEGFMEDYAVVRLNMSGFGLDLISNNDSSSSDTDGDGGFLDNLADSAKDKVSDVLNDIEDAVADKLAEELGISQWYSLHIMDMCQGDWAPNATAPSPSLNVTECSNATLGYGINFNEMLDRQLSLGPAQLSLADINWPSAIEDAIKTISTLFFAIGVLYVIAIVLSGTGMLVEIATIVVKPHLYIALINVVVSALATLAFLVPSAIVTIGARKAAAEITDRGAVVGVSAESGEPFIRLTWAAFALVAMAMVWNVVDLFITWRQRKRDMGRKRGIGEKQPY